MAKMKLKTLSGAKKRFKMTASGKIKRNASKRRHIPVSYTHLVFIKKTPFVQCGRALWAHYKSSAYYHNILCVRWLDYFWKISEPGTEVRRGRARPARSLAITTRLSFTL